MKKNKKLKVLTVCGFGVGTSLILQMNVQEILKKNDIDADVINTDITSAASHPADIIFTSNELYNQLSDKVNVPLVKISNFMDNDEIEKKVLQVIKELL